MGTNLEIGTLVYLSGEFMPIKKSGYAVCVLSFVFFNYCKGAVTFEKSVSGSGLPQTSQYVDANLGGTVSLGANMTLSIPAGALDKSTEIEVAQVKAPATADGITPLVAYEFGRHGLNFHKPALLKICYSAAALQQQGLNENSVAIYHDDNSAYVGYGGTVDVANHCVTTEIYHFSTYFVAAQALLSVNAAPLIGGASFVPSAPMAGIPLKLRSVITDFNAAGRGQVANVWLHYCVGNATVCSNANSFTKVAMLPDTTSMVTTNRFFYTIPAQNVTLTGITYFIEAIDNLRLARISPTYYRAITATATGLTLAPATFDIAAGFSRQLTVQAVPDVGAALDIDFAQLSVGNGIGNAALNNQGIATFEATTSGDPLTTGYRTGTITATLGALSASATANVWPGKLTAIQILDSTGVVLGQNITVAPNATFDFDARGLDAYGNHSLVYPAWIVTNPLTGAILNNDGVFTASGIDGQTGGVMAIVDNIAGYVGITLVAPPSVYLSLAGSDFSENGGSTSVTASLNQTYASPVTVNLAFSGSAQPGDYSASATSIIIPAGQLSADIMLTGVDNALFDGNRTVVIDIASVVNGIEAGAQQVTATIQDDETAPYVIGGTPLDGSTGNPVNTAISLNFSQPMNPATLTLSMTTACTGTIQVSKQSDNFSVCVPMNAALAVMSNGDMTATFTPAAALANSTTYLIRITAAAQGANGAPLANPITSPNGWSTEGGHNWQLSGSMIVPRFGHRSVLLNDGRILVVGGSNGSQCLASVEAFDPSANSGTGGFSLLPSMSVARNFLTVTLLNDGRVLVTGGNDCGSAQISAEIFDPTANNGTGGFSPPIFMNSARFRHSAAKLSDGRVLITGGESGGISLASAEIFDPAANSGAGGFYLVSNMVQSRKFHESITLADGRVLIAGGSADSVDIASAEIYDPAANGGTGGFFSSAAMLSARSAFILTPLPDGRVLATGGTSGARATGVDIFDSSASGGLGAFTQVGNLSGARYYNQATLRLDGSVLITGGTSYSWNSAELFNPLGLIFSVTVPMLVPERLLHTAHLLADGRVVVIGGQGNAAAPISQAEIYY